MKAVAAQNKFEMIVNEFFLNIIKSDIHMTNFPMRENGFEFDKWKRKTQQYPQNVKINGLVWK